MENQHRDIIQKNYLSLVEKCNIDLILPLLMQKKVFSPEMILKYMRGTDPLKQKRELFLDIQMRGPRAFHNLVVALRETHQNDLAHLLHPTNNNHAEPKKHAVPFMLPINENIPARDPQVIQHLGENHVGNINITTEPVKICVMPSTTFYDDPAEFKEPVYSTRSKRRGIALIINNIKYINDTHPERRGAEVDSRNLQELFHQMGLKVEHHIDLTAAQMEQVIRNFKSSPKIQGVDMIFVVVMAHGIQNSQEEATEIYGVDNQKVKTSWIEENFNNAHCKALWRKPKIFVYQTCRGTTADKGVAMRIENDSAISNMPTTSDMLVAYSTMPGQMSHRDIYTGTWYINLFCETMMNEAHNSQVDVIFKIVDSKLANLRSTGMSMQRSTYTHKSFRTCFIHPGIYLENGEIKSLHDVVSD